MASGMKEMVINTQERAISPDINRLQKFKGASVAEIFRYLADVSENFDLTPGVITEYSAVEAPLRAEIVNGVMAEPQIGSLNVLVTPGLLFALAPDGAADDSNYKFVKTAGVTVLGDLVMTANASGQTRIDVIECSITDTIVETDNRDIFNPSTGLFTAAAVTKAREGRLTFRVRLGTPGAGFPGTASGWLPLAVASVPTGTTTNNTITFWDVRPLLSDRVRGLSAGETEMPVWGDMNFRVQNNGGVTASNLRGYCRVGYRGRWLGGRLRRGTTGPSDTNVVNLRDLDVQENVGITYVNAELYYLYLLVPFGLPRWSRYTEFGAGFRRPRAPNGILVVSKTACDARSRPTLPIILPSGLGFAGGSTSEGVCISTGILYGTGLGGFQTVNRRTTMTNVAVAPANTVAVSPSLAYRAYVNPGVHVPHNAVSLWAKARVTFQSPNPPTAYHNFSGINQQTAIREESIANPGTGFTYFYNVTQYGCTLRVFNDDVYYAGQASGQDAWLPIGGTPWPDANVAPTPGYDIQFGGWYFQETFPVDPITFGAALYISGWEF